MGSLSEPMPGRGCSGAFRGKDVRCGDKHEMGRGSILLSSYSTVMVFEDTDPAVTSPRGGRSTTSPDGLDPF